MEIINSQLSVLDSRVWRRTEVLDSHRLLAKTTYFDTMQPLAFPTSARVHTNPHEFKNQTDFIKQIRSS